MILKILNLIAKFQLKHFKNKRMQTFSGGLSFYFFKNLNIKNDIQ